MTATPYHGILHFPYPTPMAIKDVTAMISVSVLHAMGELDKGLQVSEADPCLHEIRHVSNITSGLIHRQDNSPFLDFSLKYMDEKRHNIKWHTFSITLCTKYEHGCIQFTGCEISGQAQSASYVW